MWGWIGRELNGGDRSLVFDWLRWRFKARITDCDQDESFWSIRYVSLVS